MSLSILAEVAHLSYVNPEDPRADYIAGKPVPTGNIHILPVGRSHQRVRPILQNVRPVNDGKVALHDFVQQADQMIEAVRGMKLRLRSRTQAPFEILEAEGHLR